MTVDEDGHPRRNRFSVWWSSIYVVGEGVYVFLGHAETGAVVEEVIFVHSVGVMAEGLCIRWSRFSQDVEGWRCFGSSRDPACRFAEKLDKVAWTFGRCFLMMLFTAARINKVLDSAHKV